MGFVAGCGMGPGGSGIAAPALACVPNLRSRDCNSVAHSGAFAQSSRPPLGAACPFETGGRNSDEMPATPLEESPTGRGTEQRQI